MDSADSVDQSNREATAAQTGREAAEGDSPSSGNGTATRYYDAVGGGASDEDDEDEDPDFEDEPDEDDEDFDPEEDIVFHDADDGDINIEVLFQPLGEEEGEDEDEDDEEDEDAGNEDGTNVNIEQPARLLRLLRFGSRTGVLSRQQILELLRTHDLTALLQDDDSDESFDDFAPYSTRRRPFRRAVRPPVKPSEDGIKLQRSGLFGANDYNRRRKAKHMSRRLLDREHGLGSLAERRRNNGLMTQDMIPASRAEQILHYDEPVYSGQFSEDGNFYFSVCQDFRVRMYDTSNPYNWKHYKTVSYPWGSWTLTDASLSPDNKWLAYASHSSLVSIAPTDPLDTGDPYTLDLEGGLEGQDLERARRMDFSIFSIRFSGDGRELVAGTRQNSIVVYDIESRSVLHTIMGHENDVNAVCFADKKSPHILYSGSDDATLKVWDRRSMGDRREAGAFVGHNEGLTYIDSKGDGRYILSNGKDMTAKLWDLRMALSTERFRQNDMAQYTRYSEHDYRFWDEGDDLIWNKHPHDNSVVTFRGHKVMRTLIRCHFAPEGAADSRYVYSGSADGRAHIWNMDSTVAKVIDVRESTKGTRARDGRRRYFAYDESGDWETCVRDVSWHPNAPVIAASAWNSFNMARGTTSTHSFTGARDDEGEPAMGRSYNAVVQRAEGLYDADYEGRDL